MNSKWLIVIAVLFLSNVGLSDQMIVFNLNHDAYNPNAQPGPNSTRTLSTYGASFPTDVSGTIPIPINNAGHVTLFSWNQTPVFNSDILIKNGTLDILMRSSTSIVTSLRFDVELQEVNNTNGQILQTYLIENMSADLNNQFTLYTFELSNIQKTFRKGTYLRAIVKGSHSIATSTSVQVTARYNSTDTQSRLMLNVEENIFISSAKSYNSSGSEKNSFSVGDNIFINSSIRNAIGRHDSVPFITIYNTFNSSDIIFSGEPVLYSTNEYESNYSTVRQISSAGNYTVIVNATDLSGNNDVRSFTIRTTSNAPLISNEVTSPSSGATYSSSTLYYFNSTVTHGTEIDDVILEFNGNNRTASKNGDTYYVSMNLAAGTYQYRWYANDTNGNMASGSQKTYVVNKAPSSITLRLNGSSSDRTYSIGDVINMSALINVNGKTMKMYANFTGSFQELNVTGVNPIENLTNTQGLSAGTYRTIANWSGDENYTASNSTRIITLTNSAFTEPLFDMNESHDNLTQKQEGYFNVTFKNVGSGTLNNSFAHIVLPEGFSNLSNIRVSLGDIVSGEVRNANWKIKAGDDAGEFIIGIVLNGTDNFSNNYKEFVSEFPINVSNGASFNATHITSSGNNPYLNVTIRNNGSANFSFVNAAVNFSEGVQLQDGYPNNYSVGDLNSSAEKTVSWRFVLSQSGVVTYAIAGVDVNSNETKYSNRTVSLAYQNTNGGGGGGGGGGGSSGGSGGGGGFSSAPTKKKDPYLFDIILEAPKNIYVVGDPINASIFLLKAQGEGTVDVTLKIILLKEDGVALWTYSKTVAVSTNKTEYVIVPTGGLLNGEYIIRAEGYYPNAVATSEKTVNIIENSGEASIALQEEIQQRTRKITEERNLLRKTVFALLGTVIVLALVILFRRNEKKIEKFVSNEYERFKYHHICKTCGMKLTDYTLYMKHLDSHKQKPAKDWGN